VPGAPDRSDVVLVTEDGREQRFRLHDVFDFEGAAYYLVESVDDPDEVLLLREESGTLETVDGAELDRVIQALEAEG
jgi:hypothetical protein